MPSVGYQGELSRGRNEFLGNPSPAGPAGPKTGDAVFAALSASWEIDFWGRIRRLNESARASFLATEEGGRSVRLSLVAAVAQAYFELLELDRRLQIANRTTDSFKDSSRIFNERFEAGSASRLDTTRAVKAYEQAVQLSMQRYPDGKAAYFEVLDAQQQLFQAENSLARTELNQLLVVVQLYKALGGGWESENDARALTSNKK